MKAIAQMPEMTSADVAKYTTALQQAATGCAVLLDKGLISEEMALTIISRIAAEMNVEINPAAELKVASAEAAKRREADVFTEPPVVSEGSQA